MIPLVDEVGARGLVNMVVSKMAAMSDLHVISQSPFVPGPSDP